MCLTAIVRFSRDSSDRWPQKQQQKYWSQSKLVQLQLSYQFMQAMGLALCSCDIFSGLKPLTIYETFSLIRAFLCLYLHISKNLACNIKMWSSCEMLLYWNVSFGFQEKQFLMMMMFRKLMYLLQVKGLLIRIHWDLFYYRQV